jgi:ribosome-binding protein aMBF1 (putative translation factor)
MALKKTTIADFVKEFRKQAGYSQGDLAKILKYNVQMISNVERQKNVVPKEFCKRLGKKLDWKRREQLHTLLKRAAMDRAVELCR